MNKLTSLIAKHEGLRLKPYQDSVGVWTVGYGHNCQDKPISKDIAERLLEDDIDDAIQDCQTFNWFNHLTEVRQSVVIDMVFNMGLTRFKGFTKTIKYLETGNPGYASHEMLESKWADQVGGRAAELSRMMRTGQW